MRRPGMVSSAYSCRRDASSAGDRYTRWMQLRLARLCLDCDEVHEAQACPLCASEAFAYLTRWVPAPDRPLPSRTQVPPPVALRGRKVGTWLTGGVAGMTALGIAGWLWRQRDATASQHNPRK